jgi:hypothetical protein
MPQVSQAHRPKRPLVIAVVAVVGLAAIVAGVLFWASRQGSTPEATQSVLNKSADASFGGDADRAIKLLQDQLKIAKTDEEKLSLFMALGAEYEGKEDQRAALEAYLKADGIKPGYGVHEAVARTAEAVGDKTLAIEYLRRNHELIKGGKSHQRGYELPEIEAKIKQLGGSL